MTNILSIIVIFNGEKWIKKCISSVYNYSDVFIIDNASTDATIQIVKENFPKCVIFKSDKNMGFGAANNIGMKRAQQLNYDFVFLLNQDAFIEENGLKSLVELALENPEFGIISPIQMTWDAEIIETGFYHYIIASGCRELLTDLILSSEINNKVYEVSTVLAASWFVSLDCIKKVGLFDPLFIHYGEDDNYCQRVRYHGYKVGIYPKTIVCHDKPNSKVKNKKDLSSRINTELRKQKIVLADVNLNNYDRRFISSQFNLLLRFASSILRFKISDSLVYINTLKELLLVRGRIKRSRQRNVRLESLH